MRTKSKKAAQAGVNLATRVELYRALWLQGGIIIAANAAIAAGFLRLL